ncbi:MAG: tetratricopeptide repeat protein [Candidatus Thiodiazotropha sp.]|jgi:uncharacterized protein
MKFQHILILFALCAAPALADVKADIEACHRGDKVSCEDLADAYDTGDGVPHDQAKALEYYNKACQMDSAYGCRWYGIYIDPDFEEYKVEKNQQACAAAYKKGCDLDDASSCNNIGVIHRDGIGVEKNALLAKQYLTKACYEIEEGEGEACLNLGYMFSNGKGIKADQVKARAIYQKGCDEFENAASCYNLAIMYEYGEGGAPDSKLEKAYYTKACENGDEDGCDALKP